MAKIYTKVGDQGNTRLIGNCEVSKSDPRVQSYGTVDELNSHIGVVRSLLSAEEKFKVLNVELKMIQNKLFNLGSLLACADESWLDSLPQITEDDVKWVEEKIDAMTTQLPPLTQFILPGGSLIASHLHVARTVCRRAERSTVESFENQPSLPQLNNIYKYLNRLSDYLFTAARFTNLLSKTSDEMWEKS